MFFLLGNGILGSEINKLFHKKGKEIKQLTKKEIDLEKDSLDSIYVSIKSNMHRGSILINAAAYTNVDKAEIEREKTFLVNAAGPKKLAVACEKCGIHLVHISTDFIFNGQSSVPYTEYSTSDPINYYGHSKLCGENFIKNSMHNYLILRTAWLYNNSKGIIPTLIKIVKENKELRGIYDQVSAPTHAQSVAKQLYKMLEYSLTGTYHVTAAGKTTPCKVLKYLAYKLRGEETQIWEVPTYSYFYGKAPRPRMCLLEHMNLNSLGIDIMPEWEEMVNGVLNEDKS